MDDTRYDIYDSTQESLGEITGFVDPGYHRTVESTRQRMKLLIVDDDHRLSNSLASLLTVVEYDVVNVYNGMQAVEAVKSQKFDAAILDINLPDMKGIDVLWALKEVDSYLGVLILSGKASLEDAVEAVNRGADAFILKPAEPDVLLSRLKHVLRLKRLELDLKASEERYRKLFENIGDGAFQVDPEGMLTDINRAGALILGYKNPEELVNERKIWSFFASPEECEEIKTMVLRDGEVKQRLTRYRGCYGAFGWLETTLRCRIVDGQIVGFEGIFRDVTERIRYQEMLEALYSLWSDLTEVETLDDIGDLTLEFLNAILDVDTGCFRLIEGNHLSFTGEGIGWSERYGEALMGSSLSARAARTGKTQLVSDAREELDIAPLTPWDEKIISQIAVPVKINENVIAVIEIGSVNPVAYADEDQKLIEVITEHVASAMNRLIRQKLGKSSNLRLGDFL